MAGEGAEVSDADAEHVSSGEDGEKEAELLAQLSTEEVKAIMQEVCDEMLSGLQVNKSSTCVS